MVIVIYEMERVQGLARGAARPLIVNENFVRMRNEGDGFAASIYGAMPKGLRITGFPFGIF